MTDNQNPDLPENVILGLRPEDISKAGMRTGDQVQAAKCLVDIIEPAGADTFVVSMLGGTEVTARLHAKTTASPGKTLEFAFRSGKSIVFCAGYWSEVELRRHCISRFFAHEPRFGFRNPVVFNALIPPEQRWYFLQSGTKNRGMLNTIISGQPTDQPPLLIAHGLYGSARNWGAIAKTLSKERQVISVDMRNHGASQWSNTNSYLDMAKDLAEVVDANGGCADLIGHSMGGKAAMALALSQPEKLRRLIVADIAPVAYNRTQVQIIHALRNLDLSLVEKRSDADKLLGAEISDAGTRAFLLQSLDVKKKKWRFNLDVLESEMPKIMGFPSLEGPFEGPVLFLSGGLSDYILPQYRPQIKALFPKARFARIPDVGHWLHAEKPREFEATARVFFNS